MRFTKMHGTGNDYIYVNGFEERIDDPAALSIRMSRPHFGVGSDGLILILPSEKADFRMRVFNNDGSEAAMCGNGARCVGRFVHEKGLTQETRFTLETGGGIRDIRLFRSDDGSVDSVCVDMGPPQSLTMLDEWTAVSMGNPHRVYVVQDDPFDWPAFAEYAAPICRQADANIEFVLPLAADRLRMRVWERGSGETLACGSGACASFAALHERGLCGAKVSLEMRGGTLIIELDPTTGHILMTGPAQTVFEGEWVE